MPATDGQLSGDSIDRDAPGAAAIEPSPVHDHPAIDPGWLFILAGLAICAAGLLIPAQRDLADLERKLERLRQQETMSTERLNAHSTFLSDLDHEDPLLVRRLAAAHLNLLPIGDTPVLLASTAQSPVTEWIDATVQVAPAAARSAPSTALARLAAGPHRLWMLCFGVICVFVGLLLDPGIGRSRSPAGSAPRQDSSSPGRIFALSPPLGPPRAMSASGEHSRVPEKVRMFDARDARLETLPPHATGDEMPEMGAAAARSTAAFNMAAAAGAMIGAAASVDDAEDELHLAAEFAPAASIAAPANVTDTSAPLPLELPHESLVALHPDLPTHQPADADLVAALALVSASRPPESAPAIVEYKLESPLAPVAEESTALAVSLPLLPAADRVNNPPLDDMVIDAAAPSDEDWHIPAAAPEQSIDTSLADDPPADELPVVICCDDIEAEASLEAPRDH